MFNKEIANKWDNPKKMKLIKNNYEYLLKQIPELNDLDILDFGGGTGLFTEYLLNESNNVTLIDTSKDMLDIAIKKFHNINNLKIINGDINKIELNNKFDLILCNMSLHHVNDLNNTIINLDKLLNNKGYFVIFELLENESFHNNDNNITKKHGFKINELDEYFNYNKIHENICFTGIKNNREFSLFINIFRKEK